MEDPNQIRVTAATFIMPPYTPCPYCSKDSFGTLMIGRHRLIKRCRSCLRPRGHEPRSVVTLPPLDKKVIYLDQFVVSKILFALNPALPQHRRATDKDLYLRMYCKLDQLAKMQLLVCPPTEFHEHESMFTDYFEQLRDVYETLSYGVRFWNPQDIWMAQLMESFRAWLNGDECGGSNYTVDDFLYGDRTDWLNWMDVRIKRPLDAEFVRTLRLERDAIHQGLLRVFSKWRADYDKVFQDWVDEEMEGAGKKYVEGALLQLDKISNAEREFAMGKISALELAMASLPSHETSAMLEFREQLAKNGVPEELWLSQAVQFLQSVNFRNVPFNHISCHIWAALAERAAKGRKTPPKKSFYGDVQFIQTFLPYCDAMFIDKECHSLLLHKEVEQEISRYNTKIFSLRNVNQFFLYLERLEKGADKAHLDLLAEVYPPSFIVPDTDIVGN